MEAQLLDSQPRYPVGMCSHGSYRGEAGVPLDILPQPLLTDSEIIVNGEGRGGGEIGCVTLDSNLTSLCDHIHSEGFKNGVFSDVVVNAMGSTYHLHRLIISRSSYFRNMLVGPWKEANAPVLTLHLDDKNVTSEAIEVALAYLYGNYPKLNSNNAFRVLAAASFLDLQDLCSICTDFIISELWSSNFLTYQVFAESQDYGIHGERVRNACWGYLCQSGYQELKEVLPKLSPQTLHALLTSDELWVPSEEKRFELALYTFLAKVTDSTMENEQRSSSSDELVSAQSDSLEAKNENMADESANSLLEIGRKRLNTDNEIESLSIGNIVVDAGNPIADGHSSAAQVYETRVACSESGLDSRYIHQISANDACYANSCSSSSYLSTQTNLRMSGSFATVMSLEGPSAEEPSSQLRNNWPPGDSHSVSLNSSSDSLMPNVWERSSISPLTWGGRTVSRREVKECLKRQCGMTTEDYDAFVNIFEGGSLLYCNMSFEALLNVRRHLEELGFPCKAVNDGLWLQMLLSQRVHEIGHVTCKNCCLVVAACACRVQFGQSRGVTALGCYGQDNVPVNWANDAGLFYITNPAQGERSGLFRPTRVHDRGTADGLAGLGHGTTYVPATAWTPTRYVFSRVPFGIGNRNNQPHPANDGPENRSDNHGDLAGDGLTALVGQTFDTVRESMVGESSTNGLSSVGNPVRVIDSTDAGIEWENVNNSIFLDMKTPLSHFPPFRFSVEFLDVRRLNDGHVRHSPEVFYAGSLWKITVQAFSDEDPQGRRTLGLFLHRRKAEISDQLRKVYMYVDPREKVTARYQLICPSKREVTVFGSYKQTGTLLPKAPKGWGWRTALLFNELGDLLQNGVLRVAAVVQLI